MAAEDIDRYLAELTEPARGTLEQLRRDVLTVVPRAEQCISYSAPAFKVDGRTVAGFAAFKNHLSYLPHSGSRPASTVRGTRWYQGTKSSLHFAVNQPLPSRLVRKLIETRLRELDRR
jgi:uncharacterized protein YdhG (YjbR/CyaY superfamily)